MDWTAIAAIAEAIGAAGVVLSLLYVAFEVRQNTKVARAATRQALADGAQRLCSDIVEMDDIARVLQDHLEGKDLKPHELLRLQSRCLRDLRFFDNAHYQHVQGLLTAEEWQPFRENLKVVLQLPAYRNYWESFPTLFSQAFQRELNTLLAEAPLLDVKVAHLSSQRVKMEV